MRGTPAQPATEVVRPVASHSADIPVPPTSPNYLRVFREEPPKKGPPALTSLDHWLALSRVFREATGWAIRHVPGPVPPHARGRAICCPLDEDHDPSLGHLRLEPLKSPPGRPDRADAKTARELAAALAGIVARLLKTQEALWHREAELAAGIPLTPLPNEQQHLAVRLKAVLRGGAKAVGCHAAALYLLDDATAHLKLRSCWELPPSRLTDPPRPLRGAMADLEAMLGHAVVLEDAGLMPRWSPPEDFPAAVCVPVASPTNILGTLWFFSRKKRSFTDHQTNLLEIVAGRVASDLEREVLLREGIEGAQLKRQLDAAERLQRSQLPSLAPLLDGWGLAGWTAQAEPVGGDFFDWFCLPDGLVATAVGDLLSDGLPGAIGASGLRAALRSHAQYHRDAGQLLKQVNLTLWTTSAGDQFASLFCGLLDTATGRVRYASAGGCSVLLVGRGAWESLTRPAPHVGADPEATFAERECQLRPGEALVVLSEGVRDATDAQGKPLGETGIAAPLMEHLTLPAKELVTLARDRLESHAAPPARADRTILVVKRSDA